MIIISDSALFYLSRDESIQPDSLFGLRVRLVFKEMLTILNLTSCQTQAVLLLVPPTTPDVSNNSHGILNHYTLYKNGYIIVLLYN